MDTHPKSNHFSLGWAQNDEWLDYTVDELPPHPYILYTINDGDVALLKTLPATGGFQEWKRESIGSMVLA